jgi:aminopeptidase N
MDVSPPKTIKLSDYSKTPYMIETVHLNVEIFSDHVRVINSLKMKQRPGRNGEALYLNGENQQLLSLTLDGNLLSEDEYELTDESLSIESPGQDFELVICSSHKPKENTSFMGLYMSQDNYFTQCEAEGFRRITYYYDRPDCMSVFTTRIEADKKSLPVLLSNGNRIDFGDLEKGRHFCSYFDPFPKPAYLFALVAADLPKISDSYQTVSGRNVEIEIYARANDIGKCHFAMASLKRSMKWDEDFYGLECDLNAFKIVAVSDFNFGAMENKGLNIFNTSAVLASPETTTDATFLRVESVVAHEYFHNWSGNRVTCQNWFQLCLKEGLTVFRDQEFTSTMHSRGVNRIEMVSFLKERQFTEDAGPLAHPVRPEEYIQIDNFYTMTIYEKGAEICRMIHTLLGAENYRKGVDCYFSRHDGQAVTVEDFIAAMSDGSGKNLSKVMEWYKHPGTPLVKAAGNYDKNKNSYTLSLKQSNPKAPEAPPLVMPVIMGLIGKLGDEQELFLNGEALGKETTLLFEQSEQLFEFTNIEQEVVPSIFRQFSAPVKIDAGYNEDDLLHLMAHDSDEFNRYEATQELYMISLLKMIANNSSEVDGRLIKAFQTVLSAADNEPAVAALTLRLPSEFQISQEMDVINVEAIGVARKTMKETFAKNNRELLEKTYHSCLGTDPQSISSGNVGKRSLLNLSLSYLAAIDDQESWDLVKSQFDNAQNMTEEMAAFVNMVHSECSYREDVTTSFYKKWEDEDLLINSWFGEQAASNIADNLSNVKKLVEHPAFSFTNPNRLRALVGGFCSSMKNFHALDGSGYEFLADIILKVDQINSKTAARLSSAFAQWRKFPADRQSAMKKQLERILQANKLSSGTFEMISRTLKQ